MSNKEMVVYKEGIISKIEKFFKNLFRKKEIQVEDKQLEQEIEQKPLQSQFFNDIKVDTNKIDKISKKHAFLRKVDGNVEELKKLSIEELKKLDKYYDMVIAENNEIIKKLQESV